MTSNNWSRKGDVDMVMVNEKKDKKEQTKISRQELRERLIRDTIKENRVALEKLSRT